MADGYHIEKVAKFWQYIGRLTRNLEGDEESNADIGHVTKTAIFANSRWRTAAILKIALSILFSRELTDFDRIFFRLLMRISIPMMERLTKKNRNFANSRWLSYAILKFFSSVCRRHYGRIVRNLDSRCRIACTAHVK